MRLVGASQYPHLPFDSSLSNSFRLPQSFSLSFARCRCTSIRCRRCWLRCGGRYAGAIAAATRVRWSAITVRLPLLALELLVQLAEERLDLRLDADALRPVGQVTQLGCERLHSLLLLRRALHEVPKLAILALLFLHRNGIQRLEPEHGAGQQLVEHEVTWRAVVRLQRGRRLRGVTPQEEQFALAGLVHSERAVCGGHDLEVRE